MGFEDVDCTIAEAAAFLHVNPKTISSWISRYGIAPVHEWVRYGRRYPLKALVEAEFRATQKAVGRKRKGRARAIAPTA